MSRIGKKPVKVPAGVKVNVADHTINVEGPKGKLQWEFRPEVSVKFGSDEYFALIKREVGLAQYFALGQQVVVVWNNKVYRVTE